MTMPHSGHYAAELHGELWVVGDGDSTNRQTERLDRVTNQWVRGPDMMEERSYFGLAVFQGQLWAVGGLDDDSGETLSSCEYLDAVSNTWMAGPPMITGRHRHCLVVLEGQLLAIGGLGFEYRDNGLPYETIQPCVRLDAANNVWVAVPDVPVKKSFDNCFAFLS